MANNDRLQGTLDFILTHPNQHEQGIWLDCSHFNPPEGTFEERECGTVGCFAGWAAMLYGPEDGWRQQFATETRWIKNPAEGECILDTPQYHVADVARAVLGLNGDEQDMLFDGDNTIEMLTDMVTDLIENGALDEDGLQHYIERDQSRREGNGDG